MTGESALDRTIERLGSLTGSDGEGSHDGDEAALSKLRALRRLVLITIACEGWAALRYGPYSETPGVFGVAAAALGVCAAYGWFDRFAQSAVAVAVSIELAVMLAVFPENANHQFLAVLLLVLILLAGAPGWSRGDGAADASALGDRGSVQRLEGEQARLALQATRWIMLSGLFWSGVMKLWYGHWFGGEFLSFRIATDPGFARVFAAILPDPELARLVALENRVGAGPFRAAAPLLVAVSNLTWVAEIALPVGLLFAKTRRFAMVAAIALILAIQVGAREVFFGGLMIGGLLLFEPRDRVRAFVPIAGLAYLAWLWIRWSGTGEGAALVGAVSMGVSP